jgi:hypothetical protein
VRPERPHGTEIGRGSGGDPDGQEVVEGSFLQIRYTMDMFPIINQVNLDILV